MILPNGVELTILSDRTHFKGSLEGGTEEPLRFNLDFPLFFFVPDMSRKYNLIHMLIQLNLEIVQTCEGYVLNTAELTF